MSDRTPAQKLRKISEALWNAIIAKDYDGMREQARKIGYLVDSIESDHEDAERFRAMVEFSAVYPDHPSVAAMGRVFNDVSGADDDTALNKLRAVVDTSRGK